MTTDLACRPPGCADNGGLVPVVPLLPCGATGCTIGWRAFHKLGLPEGRRSFLPRAAFTSAGGQCAGRPNAAGGSRTARLPLLRST